MRSSTVSIFHLIIDLFKYKLLSSSGFPCLHVMVVNLVSCYVLVIHITKLACASVFLMTYQQVSNKTEDTEDITFDWYIYWKGSEVCCSSSRTRKKLKHRIDTDCDTECGQLKIVIFCSGIQILCNWWDLHFKLNFVLFCCRLHRICASSC